MSQLTADCPRCGVKKMTFDVVGGAPVESDAYDRFEVQCRCRRCKTSTVFLLECRTYDSQQCIEGKGIGNVDDLYDNYLRIIKYVSVRDANAVVPPTDMPAAVTKVFAEGATCMSVGCYNAAATMFRVCIDLTTKSMLPEKDENGLNNRIRRNLGFRLPFLFQHGLIPMALQELSSCVKEDGNDGAHEGTLEMVDSEDIMKFTRILLERLYTEPAQLVRASARRDARRGAG